MPNTHQPTVVPSSPPLPPLPASASLSPSASPSLPPSSASFPSPQAKPKPQAINIVHSSSLEPPSQASPRRGSIAAHLMSFASRSTTSLHILSSSAPAHSTPAAATTATVSSVSQDYEMRSQVLPLRSSPFSNPFKKLQYTFHPSSSKKSLDYKMPEKVASSSSSVNSMVSWRSKGAEMLSKKNWGRTRKNSEPTYGVSKGLPPSPIFGASIDDAVRMSHIQGTPMIPAVLFRCAEYLEVKGVDEVGLYRVPGSHASVQKLKKMFDTGKDHNLLAMEGIDPNDIATLLKLYLRELPTPLLPAVFLEQFQSLISTDRQICHTLRGILVRLPRPNYVVLSYLCHHLSRIAAHCEKTKMNVSNLGVVFAPTLSIGSVLFRALLGGYYDPAETPESREKGLKIVWGGLLQDFEYDGQDYADGAGLSQSMLTPAQEIVNATSLSVPSTSPVLTHSQSMPNVLQYASSVSPLEVSVGPLSPVMEPKMMSPTEDVSAAEDEEAKLMAAMLLREELASKGQRPEDDETASNTSSSSSIPCTDTTALSTVSSPGMNAKEQAFESSFTSPSLAFSSPTLSAAPLPPSQSIIASTATGVVAGQDIFGSTSAIPILLQEPSSPPSPLSSSTAELDASLSTPTITAVEEGSVALSATTAAPSLPFIRVSIDAGSLLSHPFLTGSDDLTTETTFTGPKSLQGKESCGEKEVHAIDFPHQSSSSGAPQLPPLEGLMIAL
ncbi:hypothetical protein BGX28_003132 [Mortierella sp. GBA30]|nr:hypothetical protein BGX28_003132 [Mortierella sp. GBA30]